MAYYVGTQQFPSVYAAVRYLSQNPQPGMTITSAPVAPAGMMTSGATKGGTMYAGGTPNFDERTGQTTGTTKGGPTKQAPIVTTPAPAPAPTPEPEMTFTFVEGKERGNAAQNYLYGQEGEVQQLTVDELRDYFESDKVNRLPEVFGTFDNYLAYMTEREQLIQSGDYDVGNWSEADTGFTQDQEMLLAGEDLTIDPSDPMQDPTQLARMQTQTQAAAYRNWINSEANQALLQKYGVAPTVYSNSGDKFQWNGSAYVKTVNEDHAGLADFVKMGITTAIGIMSGQALAPLLGGVGSAVTSSAISQAVSTGSIDPKQLLTSAATAGITQALTDIVGPAFETATGLDLSELTTGNTMADDALRAMGNSVISQGIVNGEVDINQVFTAGLFTTLDDVVDFFFNPNVSEEEARALWDNPMMREQAADLNAQLEDQFDTTVSGLIDSMDADTASYFANLTSDLSEQLTDEGAWGVTTDFDLPDTPTASQIALENLRGTSQDLSTYDNLSDDDARRFMERYGFSDEDIENYLSLREPPEVASGLLEWSNTGMMADPDMPYSINVRPETNEYFIVDPEGNYKAISEADAQALMRFEDANDWDGFTKYMNDKGIAGGGVIFGGFTDDGRPILDGADYNDWLTSSDSQPRFVDVEFVDAPFESTIPEPEVPEQEVPQPTEPVEPPEPPVVEPPEPLPEPEPEPVEPVEQDQTTGEAGTASPSPDPTRQDQPSFPTLPPLTSQPVSTQAPTPSPAPARTPQEEAPITTGMFEEYFPPAPAPAPAAPPAAASAPPPAGATPADVGSGSGAGVPAGQPSITSGDVETIVERALENIPEGMTPEQVGRVVNEAIGNIDFPEGITPSEVNGIVEQAINNIQFPEGLSTEDVEGIVQGAGFATGEDVTQVEQSLREALAAQAVGTARQLTESEARLLEQITGVEANTLQQLSTVEGALNNQLNQLGTNINDVRTELESSIAGIATSQEQATEERRNLQQAIIGAQGNIEELDANTRQQFEEFGETVTELFSDVNVDIEALQTGQISQAEAQQAFQQSTEERFGELGGQIGDIGTQLGGLASDVSGIGRGLEGLGEGVAGIGEGLGAGLLGLAAQQAMLPAQFAAVQPIDPVEFEDFYRRLTRRKIADPLRIGMFTGGARSVG